MMDTEELIAWLRDEANICNEHDVDKAAVVPLRQAADELERLSAKSGRQVCNWERYADESDVWEGDCDIVWQMIDGTPKENGMMFCPKCSGVLREGPALAEQAERGE